MNIRKKPTTNQACITVEGKLYYATHQFAKYMGISLQKFQAKIRNGEFKTRDIPDNKKRMLKGHGLIYLGRERPPKLAMVDDLSSNVVIKEGKLQF